MPALVQRPAPTFKAEAVVDGMFIDISLADYLGQWYVFFFLLTFTSMANSELHFHRVVLLFYPTMFEVLLAAF